MVVVDKIKQLTLLHARIHFVGECVNAPLLMGSNLKGMATVHLCVNSNLFYYFLSAASGLGRCKINNGDCWHESHNGQSFSACLDNEDGCKCPPGFKGDGINSLEDVDECKGKKACQCRECNCKNTWGSYDCTCNGDLLYIRDHDTCISKKAAEAKSSWAVVWIILMGLAMAGGGAYLVYRYRLRVGDWVMDSKLIYIWALDMIFFRIFKRDFLEIKWLLVWNSVLVLHLVELGSQWKI
ncbi:hypothetical protein Nepgr_004939 [Nepenthes gracilis]|uniref:EGF-like calcium-binding domain-containing protein n=1 Tax=Nepenthes gracilis TaxID=150966 RepID=A0AAD3S2A3_NEPGR|nr:hypothetical protein Nepgr_004939 [Nepenthes gracilis]